MALDFSNMDEVEMPGTSSNGGYDPFSSMMGQPVTEEAIQRANAQLDMPGYDFNQPNPMSSPAPAKSRTQAMFEQMSQTQGQPTATTYKQTDYYEDEDIDHSSTEPVETKPKGTIVYGDDTGDEGTKKPPMEKSKIIIIAAIAGVVLLLLAYLLYIKPSIDAKKAAKLEQIEKDNEVIEYLPPVVIEFKYTVAQIEALRAAGYTADEIESAQELEVPAEDLIETAEEKRQEWLNSVLPEMEATITDEEREKLNNTWYGLPDTDINNYRNIACYYEVTRNLDYEKIPVHGYQCYIKVFLDPGTHQDFFFAQVQPEEYISLSDSGNIVTTYTKATRYYEAADGIMYEDTDNYMITNYSFTFIDN